jgi:hypothetical protein
VHRDHAGVSTAFGTREGDVEQFDVRRLVGRDGSLRRYSLGAYWTPLLEAKRDASSQRIGSDALNASVTESEGSYPFHTTRDTTRERQLL